MNYRLQQSSVFFNVAKRRIHSGMISQHDWPDFIGSEIGIRNLKLCTSGLGGLGAYLQRLRFHMPGSSRKFQGQRGFQV